MWYNAFSSNHFFLAEKTETASKFATILRNNTVNHRKELHFWTECQALRQLFLWVLSSGGIVPKMLPIQLKLFSENLRKPLEGICFTQHANFFAFQERCQPVLPKWRSMETVFSCTKVSFVVFSNTGTLSFVLALSKHMLNKPKILFLSAREYGLSCINDIS